MEAFFDGTIDRVEREEELGRVDRELKAYRGISVTPPIAEPVVSASDLADIVSVFVEMPFLQRDDKRSLLRGLGVRVLVSGYKICGLAMRSVGDLRCDSDNRLKMAR